MAELFDVVLNPEDAPLSGEEIARRVAAARAPVLAPTVTDRIDASVIAACAPHLELIANFGAGVDHIDLRAAWAHHVTVTNTPGVLTEDAADLTMALILAVPRRLVEGAGLIEKGAFSGWSPTWMLGARLGGKKLGILGLGRIGQAVARRARAFGLEIHYHNRKPVSPAIAEALAATYWPKLDEMLPAVDILSVNCPKTLATHHLLDRAKLSLLKPGAFLVNTSRGDVIEEAALADLLAEGAIAGAGLDVYEREPHVHPKLLGRADVVLMPHMSSATLESRIEMGEKVIISIRVWQDGDRPPDRVIPENS